MGGAVVGASVVVDFMSMVAGQACRWHLCSPEGLSLSSHPDALSPR